MLTKRGTTVIPAESRTRSSKARTVLFAAVVGSTALTLSPITAGAVDGAGIISTVAGTGAAGTPGADGSTSTDFAIDSPEDVAFDSNGVLYYSDRNNNSIYKVVGGNTTRVAGNGSTTGGFSGDGSAATSAALDQPRGIAIDSANNLYIADSHNDRIRKVVLSTGVISTVAGVNAAGDCGETSGSVAGDGSAATDATLSCPKDVVVNDAGVMFIADSNNDRIRMVDVGGTITTLAGDGSGDGTVVGGYDFGAGVAADAKVSNPSIIVLDNAGAVVFADNGNNRIRKIVVTGTDGVISSLAGGNGVSDAGYAGDGGLATDALLEGPEGVSIGSDGVIYLSDTNNHVIRKIGTDGKISTIAGDGSASAESGTGDGSAASASELNSPEGMALDANGNLFFAAVGENSIRKILITPDTPPPAVPDWRIVKTPFANASGDSGAIARLYIAVMKRQPDQGGLDYWIDRLAKGTSYRDIATYFSTETEFQSLYGDTTNGDFIDLLYANVLDRDSAGDPTGYNYWLNRVNNGYPRVDVITFFSQSPEFKVATQTS